MKYSKLAIAAHVLAVWTICVLCASKVLEESTEIDRRGQQNAPFGFISSMMCSFFRTCEDDENFKRADVLMTIKTMDLVDAETTSILNVIFYDSHGKSSRTFITSSGGRWSSPKYVRFERNSNVSFEVNETQSLEDLHRIEIWHISQHKSDQEKDTVAAWKPEVIRLERTRTDEIAYFPIVRTLQPNVHYNFYNYDTLLPQEVDQDQDQRKKELEANKLLYAYAELSEAYSGTPMVKTLPPNQIFPGGYTSILITNIGKTTVANLIAKKVKGVGKWTSYEQMKNVFTGYGALKKPLFMDMDIYSNEWFARKRVHGLNPFMIKLCTEIPKNFGVTDELVYGLMDQKTLQDALDLKRLFITDYKQLHELHEVRKENVPAPIALFHLNRHNNLRIIAIQLRQQKGPDNPVFTPKDNIQLWQLVKMYYEVADASFHESVAHFGRTHVIMESVCCCTYQNLAPSHPIFRIMRPHFISTMAINNLAQALLTNKNGQIDNAMSIRGTSLIYIAGKILQDYNMTRDAIVPSMFEIAGTTKANLPEYHFRDDFSTIWAIIKSYVTGIVELYYPSDKVVREDYELKNWRVALTAPTAQLKGLGLKGVPGDDKKGFRTRKELIEVVTSFITTASARHAAVNFMQYDWYGYIPNFPAYLAGPIPADKNQNVTELDVIKQFPEIDRFNDMVNLVSILCNRLSKNLGYFEVPMFYDPDAQEIVTKFQRDLAKAQVEMVKTNDARKFKYHWLQPDQIPNAVSI